MDKRRTQQNGFSGALFRATVMVAAACLFSAPALSPAVGLSGDSSTYLQSRQLADETRVLGGYEYLDFMVQNLGSETISFHTGGWLRYDFEGKEYGKRPNEDLQYSFLSFKSKRDNMIVNLGRVVVFEGVAAERVDGMYARTDLKGGFGISLFGGQPVETNDNFPGNNVIYGARLSQQREGVYQIGVSALQEEKNSTDYRKEAAVDLWVHPIAKVDITGRSSWNDITHDFMEHAYVLMLGPFARLRLDTSFSQISYDDYFFRTTTPVFLIAPGIIEPHEKVRILGETVSVSVTDKVLITADYRNFDYTIAGKADYYGGVVKFSAPDSGGAGLAYHRMKGETKVLQYNEYRLYGYKKFGKINITADVLDVAYDTPVNNVKDSYSASLAAQYNLTDALRLGADVEYSHNPDFERDVRGLIKVLYHFGPKGGA